MEDLVKVMRVITVAPDFVETNAIGGLLVCGLQQERNAQLLADGPPGVFTNFPAARHGRLLAVAGVEVNGVIGAFVRQHAMVGGQVLH